MHRLLLVLYTVFFCLVSINADAQRISSGQVGSFSSAGNQLVVSFDVKWTLVADSATGEMSNRLMGGVFKGDTAYVLLPLTALPKGIDVQRVELRDPIYVASNLALPKEGNMRYTVAQSRGVQYAQVIVPVVKRDASGALSMLRSGKVIIHLHPKPISNVRWAKSFVSSSVLASGSGEWYKLSVVNTGVHRLDRAFLQQIGMNPDTIDPGHVHVFGNSFGMLPELNSAYRPDDLLQCAVEVSGAGDGSFDQGDYVLFYAKGPNRVERDGVLFRQVQHLYDTRGYYFLNINSARPQKTMAQLSPSVQPPIDTVTSFDDFRFLESENENLVKSGRGWYGDNFDVITSYNYNFSFPNVTGQATVTAQVLGNGGSLPSSYTLQVNGTPGSLTIPISSVGTGSYAPKADIKKVDHVFQPTGNNINVTLTYNKPSASSEGWLDYLQVNARRELIVTGQEFAFRDQTSVGPGNVALYKLNSAQGVDRIWEVTSPADALRLNLSYGSTSLSFAMEADTLREFVALSGTDFPYPNYVEKVNHQDLHAAGPQDMVIVVPMGFWQEAERLADHHRQEGLEVLVVTDKQVYNEFSSGARDATAIKDFMRMFYQRANGDPLLMPRYLLLFGDGIYDNRGLKFSTQNILPTYQSLESVRVTSSYTSDDYFGLLDDSEAMGSNDLLDVGVGRFPVSTLIQARNAVDKVIHYSTNTAPDLAIDCCAGGAAATMGNWRNVISLVADDEDGNDYVDGAEVMSGMLKLTNPEQHIEKIYLDAFQQDATPGGQRYPQAEDLINRSVQRGALIVNYIGHGGEVGWAHERILNVSTIKDWTNQNSLPLFMTATCEFSRFDDPDRVSAGEYVFLNPSGGGMALLTTTRLVYSWPNEVLNINFIENVLDRVNGESLALGDILMHTKNQTANDISGDNYRNFTLLGDPAMKLRIPRYQVVTDSINGLDVNVYQDTIRALGKVSISGHLRNPQTGTKLTDFNGVLYPTVFDKESQLSTLGNDPGSSPRQFTQWKNTIYSGKASITNGEFSFEFIVPKDISLDFGTGRVGYYAHTDSEDANGFNQQFMIGGVDTTAGNDDQGPVISLYLNEPSFVPGSMTSPDPVFIAELSDESGINTVGTGIGHDITLVIDGKTDESIVLNDYYEADLDTYRSGAVKFNLFDLEEGPHTLTFKAWDVYNNSSEVSVDFVVTSNDAFQLEHVLNYPNPFTTNTEFMFEHNQSCENLRVQVQVFTISGKLVKTINQIVDARGFRVSGLFWDGRDEYGDQLARGTYLYQLKVEDPLGNVASKIERLVILK